MGVDEVEIEALAQDPPEPGQERAVHQPWSRAHPDLRNHGIARVQNLDPVPFLARRRLREGGVAPEHRGTARKPGHGRDDLGRHLAGRHQVAEPVLDEDPVVGLGRVGI
jgi:hypothetical protein